MRVRSSRIVTLHAAGIRSLVAELASEGAAERAMMEAAE
jgi:hypothetical protein